MTSATIMWQEMPTLPGHWATPSFYVNLKYHSACSFVFLYSNLCFNLIQLSHATSDIIRWSVFGRRNRGIWLLCVHNWVVIHAGGLLVFEWYHPSCGQYLATDMVYKI